MVGSVVGIVLEFIDVGAGRERHSATVSFFSAVESGVICSQWRHDSNFESNKVQVPSEKQKRKLTLKNRSRTSIVASSIHTSILPYLSSRYRDPYFSSWELYFESAPMEEDLNKKVINKRRNNFSVEPYCSWTQEKRTRTNMIVTWIYSWDEGTFFQQYNLICNFRWSTWSCCVAELWPRWN